MRVSVRKKPLGETYEECSKGFDLGLGSGVDINAEGKFSASCVKWRKDKAGKIIGEWHAQQDFDRLKGAMDFVKKLEKKGFYCEIDAG